MTLEIRAVRYDDPVAAALVEQVQAEYVVRYGGPDETPVDPAEFSPPRGLFLVALLGGTPVGCGGWRDLGDGRVEVKRMFTTPGARGRGVARALLAELERTAARSGHSRVVLETGLAQPEAISLYTSSGYDPVDGFGHYAGRPLARAFGKHLEDLQPAGQAAGGAGGTTPPPAVERPAAAGLRRRVCHALRAEAEPHGEADPA